MQYLASINIKFGCKFNNKYFIITLGPIKITTGKIKEMVIFTKKRFFYSDRN